MPSRPRMRCTTPGCPGTPTRGRCATCAGRARRGRDTWTQLYGAQWPRVRLDYLLRNPVCVLCGHLAEVADHYPRGIRLLIKQRNPDPHADRHLRALCTGCHNRETARWQPGGWAAR